MSDGNNVFDLDQFRASRDDDAADDLPSTGPEYRSALANLFDALDKQEATTPIEQARIESGKAALRMATKLAADLK